MPMLDAFIPEGALKPEAEERLMARLTDLLLKHEGVDPRNERARSIAWVFVHRPQIFVAGSTASVPRYRFVASVPEGQYDAERRSAVVAAITEAVLDAEEGAYERSADRVWVFTNEVPDGTWGGRGRIFHLPDVAALVHGEPARVMAAERLAQRRHAEANAILAEAARDPSSK